MKCHLYLGANLQLTFLILKLFILASSGLLLQILNYQKIRWDDSQVCDKPHVSLSFQEYGWSNTLVSGNGPCYNAMQFRQVAEDIGVHYVRSSPHYNQSNGLAEKYFQLVKLLLYKPKESDESLNFP